VPATDWRRRAAVGQPPGGRRGGVQVGPPRGLWHAHGSAGRARRDAAGAGRRAGCGRRAPVFWVV